MNIFLSVRKFLGNQKRQCHKWRMEQEWKKSAASIRDNIQSKKTLNIPKDSIFLIIMPHSDDEWIGCSQIVIHYKNVIICNMDMDGGDSREMHKKRYEEARFLANNYCHNLLTVEANRISSLANIIRDVAPTHICIPFFFDWHPEHIRVIEMLNSVITTTLNSYNVLMYQVSVPMPTDAVNVCLPMSKDDHKKKWNVFKNTYVTQSFMPVKRFIAHEIIMGGLCNTYAAEPYIMMTSQKWLACFDIFLLNETQKKEIKESINNITKIRKYIDSLWKTKIQ